MDNIIDKLGVRVSPKVINYLNCEPDEVYVRLVNVQNISSKSLTVRFYPPQSLEFSMMCKSHEKIISSGLSHVCSVKYQMTKEQKNIDRLVITVDGQVIELPIYTFPSAPKLVIDDLIDFGTVVMANKVITTQSMLYNEGSKTGEFKFIYNGNKPLNINPGDGLINPNSSMSVQVEFVTREPQEVDELIECHFEGDEPFTIRIRGKVVQRSLVLIEMNNKEIRNINCIKFPHTYYGSDKSETALLYNKSPEAINFVAILEEDTVGQESGSHVAITAGGINPKECTNPLTSLITMYPNQGFLQPYEKVPILFRFSPRWKLPKKSFKKTLEPPIPQTFAVFIRIQIVGANTSSEESEGDTSRKGEMAKNSLAKSQQLELGVTGTALPVLINVNPDRLEFDECLEGEYRSLVTKVRNSSPHLAAQVEFPRVAHFLVEPQKCIVPAASTVDIKVTFKPKQYGQFETKQHIKVYSFVKDAENPFIEKEEPIYEQFFTLSGCCTAVSKNKEPQFCAGIDPIITNKIGICTDNFQFSDLGLKSTDGTRAAFVTNAAVASGGAVGSKLHRFSESIINPYNNRTALVAFPNDRAESIRPSERHKEYRTIFTRTKRHNYIDPDYAYKDADIRKIRHHKDQYRTLIRKRNMLRRIAKLNSKFASYENDLDIGIIPGNYLASPRLMQDEINQNKENTSKAIKEKFQILSSKELNLSENILDISKIETFNAIPTTNQEKNDCSMILTPQQLHQIVFGPSTINFGEIAVRSTAIQELTVINNLDTFIHVIIDINCKELLQSSPLSQVVPPKTKTIFPLIFETSKKGKFQRNLNYTINGYYHNHVIVLANVVPNRLELSTEYLSLQSSSILPPDTGIRGHVTLHNPLNSQTEFQWEPIFNSCGGISFSIRPKNGIVEAGCQLDCEVEFHPGFMAPSEGKFLLLLPGNQSTARQNANFSDNNNNDNNNSADGNEINGKDIVSFNHMSSEDITTSSSIAGLGAGGTGDLHHIVLTCVAQLGTPYVALQSRRVMFGNVPINLSSSRTVALVNTGSSHAFFHVISDSLQQQCPGMSISPLKGSVIVGGQTELSIKYLPKTLNKFDFSIPIVIRGWREIELKISGNIIIPNVEIDLKRFDFGGVPVGSDKKVLFNLINKSYCRSEVEFDFLKQRDFYITVEEDEQNHSLQPKKLEHKYLVVLRPAETVKCCLHFAPTEVASYEFPCSIRINRIDVKSSDGQQHPTRASSIMSNETMSESTVGKIESHFQHHHALQRIISATAIRQPIKISKCELDFQSPQILETERTNCKKLVIFSTMESRVSVCLKLSSIIWKYGSEKINMKYCSRMKLFPFRFSMGTDKLFNGEDDINIVLDDIGCAVEIEVAFAARKSGYFEAEFPVYINDNFENEPFQNIKLTGFMDQCKLICNPTHLYFTPVPLHTEIFVDFKVTAINFTEHDELDIRLPLIKNSVAATSDSQPRPTSKENNSNDKDKDNEPEKLMPFKLYFGTSREILSPEERTQISEDGNNTTTEILVRLTFFSKIVLNVRSYLELVTTSGKVYQTLGVSAVADNSILSWLPFYNKHQSDYHIVCDEGKSLEGTDFTNKSGNVDFGVPQLKCVAKDFNSVRNGPDGSSLHSRNSTTITSSNFEDSTSSYDETITESESVYFATPIPPREGALNNIVANLYRDNKKLANPTATKMNSNSKVRDVTTNDSSSVLSPDGESTTTEMDILAFLTPKDIEELVKSVNEGLAPSNDKDENGRYFNIDFDAPDDYESDLLQVMQRWFAMYGWPNHITPLVIPATLRNSLQRRFGQATQMGKGNKKEKEGASAKAGDNMENTGVKTDSRDLYDMMLHVTGRQVIGINTTVSLPSDLTERACHIYVQHATLIAFIENHSGTLSQVMPEFLMEPSEYELWHKYGCPGIAKNQQRPPKFDLNVFEKISKKAWTTVLLQLIKTFILSRINMKGYRNALQPVLNKEAIPDVVLNTTASNCYSLPERILLAWLNYLYETNRHKIWPLDASSDTDESATTTNTSDLDDQFHKTPSSRWIINFDNDFMDSLIIATVIAAYVPHLIEKHLRYMYTNPKNAEQFFHNALKIVTALSEIGIEFDIKAIDIVDPNPIMMMLLTMHLFNNLPLYIPKSDVVFTGALHEQIIKHIMITNPTSKPLNYECLIIGPDTLDFSSPKGSFVNLGPKASQKWPIQFRSRFIRPAEAVIMFVGRKSGSIVPTNLIFKAKSKITSNNPLKIEKVSGKCYEMKEINLKIMNPYHKDGVFTVKLIENSDSKTGSKDTEPNKSVSGIFGKPFGGKKRTMLESIKPENKLRAFFCHTETLYIEKAGMGTTLPLFYLPFHMGIKQCSIIFSNDEIGEFVQSVEATALLPDPISLNKNSTGDCNSNIPVTNNESGSGGDNSQDHITYWKCEVGSFIKEKLAIPIRNLYKEKALFIAAQHHLSEQEVSRRQITGTLNSSSLLVNAVQMLTVTSNSPQQIQQSQKVAVDTKYTNKANMIDYELECDSPHFKVPAKIQIPDPLLTLAANKKCTTVEIPVEFHASNAGTYNGNLIVSGPDDVRVHRIECCVTPEGLNARLHFSAPVNDIVTQQLPIVNKTRQDWPLRAEISVNSKSAFSGPEYLVAKALTVSQYTLQFKPVKEGKFIGKLSLINESDGTEHIYELTGEGESPLAMESIHLECSVGDKIFHTINVPNSTRKKHVFVVESDLDWMLIGPTEIPVLPNRNAPYQFTIEPKCHGQFTGVLAFVSGKKEIKEYDSDGEEMMDIFDNLNEQSPEATDNKSNLYRIWYSITVNVIQGPPKGELVIECPCLDSKPTEIQLTNPLKDKYLKLKVIVEGRNLEADRLIEIAPESNKIFTFNYTPSAKGEYEGKIIFYEETIGEFWYKLRLTATNPTNRTLDPVSCELGKWMLINIPLKNLDDKETLFLQTELDNLDCYSVCGMRDNENESSFQQNGQQSTGSSLSILPLCNKVLVIRFNPCSIGSNSHNCSLTLTSSLLGEWTFYLKGRGLPPIPSDTIGIITEAGSNSTVLVPFHNPMLDTVLIDICIREEQEDLLRQYKLAAGDIDVDERTETDAGIFRLLLKNNRKLKLKPKQNIEIPISFAPQEMRKYNAICSIILKKKDGNQLISDEDFEEFIASRSEVPSAYDKFSLRWLYPIQGIPEAASQPKGSNNKPLLVQGPARVTTKERLQLSLWGLPPPITDDAINENLREAGTSKVGRPDSAPITKRESNEQQIELSKSHLGQQRISPPLLNPLLQQFSIKLEIKDSQSDNDSAGERLHNKTAVLNDSVKLEIEREEKRVEQGLSVVHCLVTFRPMKKFKTTAEIVVTSASGGIWRFPVRFIAHECEPDDEVVLEAVALYTPVSVQFHLNSRSFENVPFKAYFLKGSDPNFTVSPTAGELPPVTTQIDDSQQGLPFTVTWTPQCYSRCKGAVLVVETLGMEWIYKFNGVNPRFIIPRMNSMVENTWDPEIEKKRLQKSNKKNILQQNIELLSTGVSSPIKGAPLFPKIS